MLDRGPLKRPEIDLDARPRPFEGDFCRPDAERNARGHWKTLDGH